jgi:hypothetical protein
MKTIIFIVSLITLISQTGCKQTTESSSSGIFVSYEVESAFQNDSVKVALDDKTLLESRVTTNYTISLAWSSGLQKLSRDNHFLHFGVVEYGVQKDYRIDTANDTSTVLLRFDKSTKQISFQQIRGRIFRD